ncbi:unnamed protein product [Fraxinus pennsylvanica]|uniref:Uncharacterized protein n=1 Tax=Fraxinus pennsylvanica TaxID=56036 RepID=A0AAD2A684_9LAMI|nr:unnamed protein product [Fraxinus pennsylvanica]
MPREMPNIIDPHSKQTTGDIPIYSRTLALNFNSNMGIGSLRNMILVMMILLKGAFGIDREECLSHDVHYEGDTVHLSFVVIKANGPWDYGDEEGVHLLIVKTDSNR